MTYSAPFRHALQFVVHFEGGEVNNPNDPGGHTNYGVTQRTLNIAREKFPKAGLPESVSDLTDEHVSFMFWHLYWLPVKCDQLSDGLALVVFDGAINQGISAMGKHLQRAVGAIPDGIVGSKTIAHVIAFEQRHGCERLIQAVAAERALGYARTGEGLLSHFGRGWYRRLLSCYSTALSA